jgi:hypothetical protein
MKTIRTDLFNLMIIACIVAIPASLMAQNPNLNYSKFKQLKEELPTPNAYRTASGAPGHEYYQQQADYVIEVTLSEDVPSIQGTETITYHNNSPDALDYLWLQLDQNVRAKDADRFLIKNNSFSRPFGTLSVEEADPTFDGGFNITRVTDAEGNDLDHTINKTMMRIDLEDALLPGARYSFSIDWHYNINDRTSFAGRSGYEYFPEEDNYLFAIGQFYPRMAVYNDVEGWQHKQFHGVGEFAVGFGDFDVKITVPADHLVAATGELQNASEVLTAEQRKRLEKARTSATPVMIVTEEEARKNERTKSVEQKTWHFKAQRVRDFAFASSRKHIWDARGVDINGKTVMAMSMWPKECNPLWQQYSTKTTVHTVKHYSDYLFDYPYPVVWSVHADNLGMEFPMIGFNWGRPEPDGTYTSREKYFLIAVIIHEIGHNWFPMIVNSDERQWAWMDETLNSFVQFLAENKFQRDFPHRRGEPWQVVSYMKGDKSNRTPLMTNPESIPNLGWNSYNKGTTALNILRETVMGRELFDHAFKVYANRWKFKHPTPADFFRTMEDASGVDLDWFWRGWFYSTDHVDISIDAVQWYKMNTHDPDIEKTADREADERKTINITDIRNNDMGAIEETYVEADPDLKDFYNSYDKFEATILDRQAYEKLLNRLNEKQLAAMTADRNYYELTFSNIGGLVMPLILEFEFANGEKEIIRIPAEIWRLDKETINKIFVFDEEVVGVTLDPFQETADTDLENNFWPARIIPSRFDIYMRSGKSKNPMQLEKKIEELEKKEF